MARKGYWGGNPEGVLSAPVDMVFECVDFEIEMLVKESEGLRGTDAGR